MPRKHLPRSGVAKLNGKRPWRVVGDRDIPINLKSGKPLDRGGYDSAESANAQATAFNEAVERNASARALAGITKRQRVESRRAAKRRQREAAQRIRTPANKEVDEMVHALGQGKFPTTTVSVYDSPAEAYAKMENANA